MLGTDQRATLSFFLETITLVLSESHQLTDLPGLDQQLNNALALLERDFPVYIHVCLKIMHVFLRVINLIINRILLLTCCIILLRVLPVLDQCTQLGCILLSVLTAGYVEEH